MTHSLHTTQDDNNNNTTDMIMSALLAEGHYETPFSLPDPPPVPAALDREYGPRRHRPSESNLNNMAGLSGHLNSSSPTGYRSAVVFLTRAITFIDPNSDKFYLKRSHCYEKLGNFIAAREDALKAIQLRPRSLMARVQLSRALVGLKQFQEAEQILRQAIDSETEQDRIDLARQELAKLRAEILVKLGLDGEVAEGAARSNKPIMEAISDVADEMIALDEYGGTGVGSVDEEECPPPPPPPPERHGLDQSEPAGCLASAPSLRSIAPIQATEVTHGPYGGLDQVDSAARSQTPPTGSFNSMQAHTSHGSTPSAVADNSSTGSLYATPNAGVDPCLPYTPILGASRARMRLNMDEADNGSGSGNESTPLASPLTGVRWSTPLAAVHDGAGRRNIPSPETPTRPTRTCLRNGTTSKTHPNRFFDRNPLPPPPPPPPHQSITSPILAPTAPPPSSGPSSSSTSNNSSPASDDWDEPTNPLAYRNLLITGLDSNCKRESLRSMLELFAGERSTEAVRIWKRSSGGGGTHCALVRFYDEDAALHALISNQGKIIAGVTDPRLGLSVRLAPEVTDRMSGHRVEQLRTEAVRQCRWRGECYAHRTATCTDPSCGLRHDPANAAIDAPVDLTNLIHSGRI